MKISNFDMQTHTASLPEGYTLRAPRLSDAPGITEMVRVVERLHYGTDGYDEETIRSEMTSPHINMDDDMRVVVSSDGAIVGFIACWLTPPERVFTWGHVHPAHEGRGIGTALMGWAEERARRNMQHAAPDTRVTLSASTKSGYAPAETLFKNHDMSTVRYFKRMAVSLDNAPADVQLPDGFAVRRYHHPDDLETIARGIMDAFRDHWGFVETPLEEEMAEWRHMVETDTKFRPENWLLAVDAVSGELAGMALTRIPSWSDPDYAIVDVLGVLRPYRKRGLGRALLLKAFEHIYAQGMSQIALFVDADSLTGATRLYESVGMHVDRVTVRYEKELRPGKDLATKQVED